jgi:non-ribosomal peptide synthetase component F
LRIESGARGPIFAGLDREGCRSGRAIHLQLHGAPRRPTLPHRCVTRRWSYKQAAAAADALYAGRDVPHPALAFVHAHDLRSRPSWPMSVRRGAGARCIFSTHARTTANARLIARYRPDIVIDTSSARAVGDPGAGRREVSPDIAILLSTSGSTGTPKFVKLSHGNIAANTASIISYLGSEPCRCGDHVAQAALFLRHVRGEHASRGRRRARRYGSRHRQPGVLGAGPQ